MLKFREKVFETNSSSEHSLSFSTKGSAIELNGTMRLGFVGDDWGWEFRSYSDPQSKFSYWLNAFVENQGLKLKRENEKARNVDYYYITDFIGDDPTTWNVTRGPALEEVYIKVLEETKNKLKNVLELFREHHVEFTFDPNETIKDVEYVESIEDFIRVFEQLNSPECDKKRLCNREFNYYVELGYGIDHQSSPRESEECEALAEFEPEDVLDWVLGDGSFETGNDNC